MKVLLKIIVFVFLLNPLVSFAYSDEKVPVKEKSYQLEIVDSLLKHGIHFLESNDIAQAIDDFTKVLLIDADDQTAIEYLQEISLMPQLMINQKVDLIYLNDLIVNRNRLRSLVVHYEEKASFLADSLMEGGLDSQWLHSQMSEIKMNVLDSYEKPLERMQRPSVEEKIPMAAAVKLFKTDGARLQIRLTYLKEQYQQLDELTKNDFSPPVKIVTSSFLTENKDFRNSLAVSDGSKNEMSRFRVELDNLRGQLTSLKEDLRVKDEKLVLLTRELINYTLTLKEKESLLSQKSEHFKMIEEEFLDMESRLKLGQKIVEEKNKEITVLKKEIQNKSDFKSDRGDLAGSLPNSKKEKLIELKGIVNIYKGKLKDSDQANKNKENALDVLEEKVHFVEEKLVKRNQLLKQTRDELSAFERQLKTAQSELNRLKENKIPEQTKDIEQVEDDILKLQTQIRRIHDFLIDELISFRFANDYFANRLFNN